MGNTIIFLLLTRLHDTVPEPGIALNLEAKGP